MRGPSIRPALIASRSATSMNHVPPGMDRLVTPERRTSRALRAARMVENSGLVAPLAIFSPGMAGWPKERWQWPSIRPGIIHLPAASMVST